MLGDRDKVLSALREKPQKGVRGNEARQYLESGSVPIALAENEG
jgi:hypothetical protein